MGNLSKAHHDRQIERLDDAGILFALRIAVQTGTANEWDQRYQTFSEPILARRVKGANRTAFVDRELMGVAERFKMTVLQIPTGRSGHPEMIALQWEEFIFSAHQITGNDPRRAPTQADYRDLMMPPPVDYGGLWAPQAPAATIVIPNNLEFWPLTYPRTLKRLTDWITLGRSVQGQRSLFYARDLLAATAHEQQLSQGIDFNPESTLPKLRLVLPGTNRKPEGEGE